MVTRQNNASKNPDETRRPRYLGEAISPASGESSDWHTHEFGQLVSAASGSMYVGTRNRVLLLSPAMVVWIPPDVEHWNRHGLNNDMLYVDVNRDKASTLGSESRIMAMTPLLNALMAATLPENISGRACRHVVALYDLIRHELITAKDVALSIVMPNDRRIRRFTDAALDDPGRGNRSMSGLPMPLPAARLSNDCSSRKQVCRRRGGCGKRVFFTPYRGLPLVRKSVR